MQFAAIFLLDPSSPAALAIGNFDGVQSGHRAVKLLTEIAKRTAEIRSQTFEPHPREFFSPPRRRD